MTAAKDAPLPRRPRRRWRRRLVLVFVLGVVVYAVRAGIDARSAYRFVKSGRGWEGRLFRADEVLGGEHPAVDETVRVRALLAWSALYGAISFELFGHFVGSVLDADRWFDRAMGELAGMLGL